ncbi:hypothetical protein KB553_09620 [Chryseobacterium rhizoplanae]|uniref:hypothetical protein n=1 Tax=Chryseobacterium rhizoplanae TaxID=1609531 RepID=UPI001CE2F6E8|nr:hypothetical protein [Chryseobacterium rhizoplanae]UCA61771.1 hypothetical protein KB553_09620 [Chryseobacterium rhizoplanae]
MVEKLKYYPLHWMDGMKINKSHFTAIQNFVSDAVRDVVGAQISPVNYGLLPINNSIEIKLTSDQHKQLKVTVEQCHGITPNGSRIEISAEEQAVFQSSFLTEATYMMKEDENVKLMVCLSVHLFNRIPFGEPDPDENPPRYPFTRPEYILQLIPENELKGPLGLGGSNLTVARISVSAGECEIDPMYIPACQCTMSHNTLKKFYVETERFFNQMELLASQIRQKIRFKKQNNLLSLIVDDMADKVVCYLGMEMNRYRWTALYQPPIYMFSSVIALGRILKNCIEVYTGSGKEELINYVTEWCNIGQGDFEFAFSDILNEEYDHQQIGKTAEKVGRFMKTAEEIFNVLSQLDYIGKKRDGSIFISERPGDKDAIIHSKRNQSFLAD